MKVEEAARRLTVLGKFTGDPILGLPHDLEFPFAAGMKSPDDSIVLAVKDTDPALCELEKRMKA